MSKHGREVRCACGATAPISRETLKAQKQPGGWRCRKCKGGKARKRQRPVRYQ